MAFKVPRGGKNIAGGHDLDQENRGGVRQVSTAPRTPMSALPRSTASAARTPHGAAGAVSEEALRRAFTAVPKYQVLSVKDLQHHLDSARTVLENDANDWDKRTKALQLVRSVVLGGGLDFEAELVTALLDLEDALVTSVKDLRSQVCKEACITICFLADKLGPHLVRLMDDILPHTLALVQNSAKVMATSGAQACDFIIKNVEHPTLLPIILSSTAHKSKEMRRHTLELINQVLSIWSPTTIRKHIPAISSVIETGFSDADPAVRLAGRNAYQQLDEKWPEYAQQLFKRLDSSKQKALSGGASAASSAQSLCSLPDGMPFRKRPGFLTGKPPAPSSFFSGRSASAIDSKAVQKAAISLPRFNGSFRLLSGTRAVARTPLGRPPSQPKGMARGGPAAGSMAARRDELRSTPAPQPFTDNLNTSMNRLSMVGSDEDFLLGDKFSGSPRDAVLLKALKTCASSNFAEKRDGLKEILDLLKSGHSLKHDYASRVTQTINKLMADWNHRLISLLVETICELVRTHNDVLADWLPHLLAKLISKHTVELLPAAKESINTCLATIRESVDKNVLFNAMCKVIVTSPIQLPSPKVKQGILTYLLEVLSGLESGVELNTELVRGAVHKIFEWIEEPKNASFRQTSEQVVVNLFSLNTADFSAMLSTLPPSWKDFAFSLLSKTRNSTEKKVQFGSPRVTPQKRRDVRSSPSVASPARVDHVMGARADHVVGEDAPRSMLGALHSGNNSPTVQPPATNVEGENESFKETDCLLDQTIHLANDEAAQKGYIDELLDELTDLDSTPDSLSSRVKALRQLHQMVSEGSLTSWDETFRPLLVRLFDCLACPHAIIKRHAIRLLGKMCLAQASRFNEMTDLVLLKLFSAVADEEMQKNMMLMSAADDCMKVLATHLPSHLLMRTLKPIIHSASGPSIICALKMLERVIDTMSKEELSSMLDDITPSVIACYSNPVSSVRKVAVFSLVAIVHKMGKEAVQHHLEQLDFKGRRVLDVYVQRREAAANRSL